MAAVGLGPHVLSVPPLVSNIEVTWEHEFYRLFFEYHRPATSRNHCVRQAGDRAVGQVPRTAPKLLKQRTGDILAVMNAAGLERPVASWERRKVASWPNCSWLSIPDRVSIGWCSCNANPAVRFHRCPPWTPTGRWTALQTSPPSGSIGIVEAWGRDPQSLRGPGSVHRTFLTICGVRAVGGDVYQRQSATAADIRAA